MQTPKTVDISGHEVKIIVRDALYSVETLRLKPAGIKINVDINNSHGVYVN
jgi:hypothetical protein